MMTVGEPFRRSISLREWAMRFARPKHTYGSRPEEGSEVSGRARHRGSIGRSAQTRQGGQERWPPGGNRHASSAMGRL